MSSSQCVPSWDLEDNNNKNKNNNNNPSSNPDQAAGRLKVALLRAPSSNSMSSSLNVPTLDYEVAELTWKNGQVAMHGLGPPRVVNKYTWEKPRAGAETLEAIVNQATYHKPQLDLYANDLVPWIDHHSSAVSVSKSATMTMDALVPSANTQPHALLSGTNGALTRCSTRVASCSGAQSGFGDHMVANKNGGATAREWSSGRDQSVSGSETFGMESSRQLTFDTCERELGVKGFTSPSMGSPGTVSGKHSAKSTSPDENDSVCHSRPQKSEVEDKKKGKGKSSTSTKRSRAAAIHNQSERKRRDKINEKMKTLQKLVPNANKTDKASMLDEVIEYLKQLQAQIHMIGRMSMSPMMMAMQQQQQLQMAMMNPMTMGMGIGMGMPGVMDLNAIGGGNRPNILGMPAAGFHPSTFMQPSMVASPWDMQGTGERVTNQNDPMAAFLACQSQPMTMDSYNRMAAMFQQMQNQPAGYSGLKN